MYYIIYILMFLYWFYKLSAFGDEIIDFYIFSLVFLNWLIFFLILSFLSMLLSVKFGIIICADLIKT